jgi:hypothetical protein
MALGIASAAASSLREEIPYIAPASAKPHPLRPSAATGTAWEQVQEGEAFGQSGGLGQHSIITPQAAEPFKFQFKFGTLSQLLPALLSPSACDAAPRATACLDVVVG